MRHSTSIDLKKSINEICFYEFEGVRVGDVLHYHLVDGALDGHLLTAKGIFKIVRRIITHHYNYNLLGTPRTVFLFSESYGEREDQKRAFLNTVSLVENALIISYSGRKMGISWKKIKTIPYLFIWCKQMKDGCAELTFPQILFLCSILFSAFLDWEEFTDYEQENDIIIDNIVSWCDVQVVDSMFVQRFNQTRKGHSVSLQHGFLSNAGNLWALHGPHSQYYYVDSCYSRDTLLSNGYRGKVVVCGSPYRIGSSVRERGFCSDVRVIGIFLCSEVIRECSEYILSFFDNFSKDSKYKYLIKFHPSSDLKTYNKDNYAFASKVYGKELTAEQFIDLIDVGIVFYSNTFIELLNARKAVLQFKEVCGKKAPFVGIDSISFRDFNSLQSLLSKIETGALEDIYVKMANYYCTLQEIDSNYKNAFENIEKEDN